MPIERPKCVKEIHLGFLDHLRISGVTNMWGAVPYLTNNFLRLSKEDAKIVLKYWMDSFGERHPNG